MAQNRPPPAFQEYAATMLANFEFRQLDMAARGLLMTMRLECWVNERLPESPEVLATVLNVNVGELKRCLPRLQSFFSARGGYLICPELDDYRAHLLAIKEKQAAGGKRGAEKTNAQRQPPRTQVAQGFEGRSADPQVPRRLAREYSVKSSAVKSSQTQSLESGVTSIDDDWVRDYDRASNGG